MSENALENKITDLAEIDQSHVSELIHFAYLTQTQKVVLAVMIDGMTTDLIYTDMEIAEKAGVGIATVKRAKINAHFLECLCQATKNIAKSHVPQVVKSLEKKALDGSVRAMELMMRYSGDYTPKSQLESKSQNVNISAKINASDAIGEFVALLCDKGWNKARILDEINRVYDQLKEQGRIV